MESEVRTEGQDRPSGPGKEIQRILVGDAFGKRRPQLPQPLTGSCQREVVAKPEIVGVGAAAEHETVREPFEEIAPFGGKLPVRRNIGAVGKLRAEIGTE